MVRHPLSTKCGAISWLNAGSIKYYSSKNRPRKLPSFSGFSQRKILSFFSLGLRFYILISCVVIDQNKIFDFDFFLKNILENGIYPFTAEFYAIIIWVDIKYSFLEQIT